MFNFHITCIQFDPSKDKSVTLWLHVVCLLCYDWLVSESNRPSSTLGLPPFQTLPISSIKNNFPFTRFFEDAPQPVFKGNSFDEDFEIAQGCFRYWRW